MQFELGVRAGLVLTMKEGRGEVLTNAFIGVRGNEIAAVAEFKESFIRESKTYIDASHQLLTPGLINGHTHLAMSLFRGFRDDSDLKEWLNDFVIPCETQFVAPDFVEAGVLLSALECIRFGTTTVNDMYFHSEVTAKTLDRAGLRAIVHQHLSDQGMLDEAQLSHASRTHIEQVRSARLKNLIEKYAHHPRIKIGLGPHAPYSCSDGLLEFVKKMAHETHAPIHMHVCETRPEVEESIQTYHATPVERLLRLGLLDHPFVIAHGVHLSDTDLDIIARSGTSVIYNPDSNSKLGSGIANIPHYRKKGVVVGIGSDGAASNNDLSLFGAMDLGTKIQKLSQKEQSSMTALDAFTLATYEGARALQLGHLVGSIEEGKRADFILLNLDEPHLKPLYSVLSQLVYSVQGLEVDTVVCDGQILMENQQFQSLNATEIYATAEHFAKKITEFNRSLNPKE